MDASIADPERRLALRTPGWDVRHVGWVPDSYRSMFILREVCAPDERLALGIPRPCFDVLCVGVLVDLPDANPDRFTHPLERDLI